MVLNFILLGTIRPRGIWALSVPSLHTARNHEDKMEERSKRYKKIDFLGEGQVQSGWNTFFFD